MTTTVNIGLVLVITIIFIFGIWNIYQPFITTHPAEPFADIVLDNNIRKIRKQVAQEISDITESSERDTLTAGFDETTQGSANESGRPRLIVNEGFRGDIFTERFSDDTGDFTNDTYELRLFFRPDCPYSNEFIPIWLELSRVLPANVRAKEVNCSLLDENGISICASWLSYGGGISSVPALQLVSTRNGVVSRVNYSGERSYVKISQWLSTNGIQLPYNPNAEHFSDQNPNPMTTGLKEGFSGAEVLGDHLSKLKEYNALELAEAQEDAQGNIQDIDNNGVYKASFSTIQGDDGNNSYQVFTRRGQYGYVKPDINTPIKSNFDAAFAAVDGYLNLLPPKIDPSTGELAKMQYTDAQRLSAKIKAAKTYKNDIRGFGLCDKDKLNDRYNTLESVRTGKSIRPPGITDMDYMNTQETAQSIWEACKS